MMRSFRIGGNRERLEIMDEQVVLDAREALAQLRTVKTEAQQLVTDLRERLAEVDDIETFAQNVNYYRQKQQELEALLAEVTATRTAAETFQKNAERMLSAANTALGNAAIHDASIAQSVEANEYAIDHWRQELGNANNVYTGLGMLGLSQASTFAGLLASMATPSVGLFHLSWRAGQEVPNFVKTMFGEKREFLPDMSYQMNLTVDKNEGGYMATVAWTAFDANEVYSPITYEDRTVMGKFDTGWAVRAYHATPNVMSR